MSLKPLHWNGTPLMLQALRRSWTLTGNWIGTLAVISKQAQSTLVFMIVLNALQQLEVGDDPLLLLPVMKLKHGVKFMIIEVVHDVVICPLTDAAKMATITIVDIAIRLTHFNPSI